MDMNTTTSKFAYQFLGLTFLGQASTSLIGGLLFKSLESKTDIAITMDNISKNISTVNLSIFLQFVTAIIIIMLGVAIYRTAGHINKTLSAVALLLYVFEAMLLAVGQVFIIGLRRVSEIYLTGADAGLQNLGNVLLSCRHFSGEIAMLPFGIGAIIFYYQLGKSEIIPKWLAAWGLITAPFILIYFTLGSFGIALPLVLCFPYVPFEFFTGIFIMIKYRKNIMNPN
jgi:hypothetical protein